MSEHALVDEGLPTPEELGIPDPNNAGESNPGKYDHLDAPYGRFRNGKPRKSPGKTGAGSRSGNTKVSVSAEVLADKIVEYVGIPMAGFSPLALAVMDDRSEKFAESLILLGNQSPRIARAVNAFVKTSAYGELIMFPIAIVFAIMIDYNQIAPNQMIAEKLGITEKYILLQQTNGNWEEAERVSGNGHRNGIKLSGFDT